MVTQVIKSLVNSGIKNLLEFTPFRGCIKRKYHEYLGDTKRDNILISFDTEMYPNQLLGEHFNMNTLEPCMIRENGLKKMNDVLETTFDSLEELHVYMKANKTNCALKIFNSTEKLKYPQYLTNAFNI